MNISKKLIDQKKSRYVVVNLQNWQQAKDIFEKFNSSKEWIFRGQANSSWNLVPLLYRFAKYTGELSIEEMSLNLFRKKATDYSVVKKYNPRTSFEWLYMMQHYGVPTRLLDWTHCPYIATFFALQSSSEQLTGSKFCAIWAVNQYWCKRQALTRIKTISKYSNINEDADLTTDEHFVDLFLDSYKHNLNFVYPLKPKPDNMFPRIKKQEGIFLCQGNDDTSFEDNLLFDGGVNVTPDNIIKERKDNIFKFVIENKYCGKILKDLDCTYQINQKGLFGSLDQYGHQITIILEQIDEYSKTVLKKVSVP